MQKPILFILCSLIAIHTAWAEPIQLAENLALDAREARREAKPIVLFVTANHCPYCDQLREEYFQFSRSDPRFILRELELDMHHDVVDFNGDKSNHQSIADRYDIWLTPTVAFVGPDGKPLNDSIVGVLTMDFYDFYFEQALEASVQQMQDSKLAKQP